jgi:DNA processing protein
VRRELDLIERHEVSIVTLCDEGYPSLLSNIAAPPPLLYVHGAPLSSHKKCLAVIGSRGGTSYAQSFITSIVEPLRDGGWSVVSGGAIGIDTMAHREMVACGGKTIVVLGSGLLVPYPYSNRELFERIVYDGGTIISELPLHTPPSKGSFPARNRIIAGLARGTLVVQAGERSGTRITALCALEEGREVFAVPGSYDNQLSRGCHALIQQGAKLVTSIDDILIEFGEVLTAECNAKTCQGVVSEGDALKERIVTMCKEPVSIDELAQSLSMPIHEVQDYVFSLQVEGHIEQNFMGLFQQH